MTDFRVVPRSEWGAVAPHPGISALKYPVADVFLHHEAGAVITAAATPSQECERMREIQRFTMNEGYTDFPYGLAVFPSGRIYEGRDLGFVCGGVTAEEAATLDHNSNSVAIVWPGNYDIESPTVAQISATGWAVQLAQLAGVVSPVANLRGHRDVYATACPGSNAYSALGLVRASIGKKVAPAAPAVAPATPPAQTTALKALAALVDSFTKHPAKAGESGKRIRQLQTLLAERGLFDDGYKPTGTYGEGTVQAVKRFKTNNLADNHDGRTFGHDAIVALLAALAKSPKPTAPGYRSK